MDTIEQGPQSPDDGARTPGGRTGRRRHGRGLAAAAVLVTGLAAGATGVALATDSPTPSPSASSPTASPNPDGGGTEDGATKERRGPGRGGLFGGPGMHGLGGALHGEAVVPKADEGYQTVHTQRGDVTKVSNSSITVKSEDGFSQTYVVTADTVVNANRDGIDSIDKGDEVHVLGVEDGGDITALQVRSKEAMEELRQRFGPRGGGRGPGAPVPDGDTTTPDSGETGATTGLETT